MIVLKEFKTTILYFLATPNLTKIALANTSINFWVWIKNCTNFFLCSQHQFFLQGTLKKKYISTYFRYVLNWFIRHITFSVPTIVKGNFVTIFPVFAKDFLGKISTAKYLCLYQSKVHFMYCLWFPKPLHFGIFPFTLLSR